MNLYFFVFSSKAEIQALVILINPHTLVAQKIADEVVFQHFQGDGVEFFF